MEVSPIQLLFMVIASFAFGMACGVLNDVNRLVRVLLGVKYLSGKYGRLYKIKLPVVRRSLEEIKDSRAKRFCLPAVIFVQDIFLFVVAGGGVAIINYCFNSGRVRIYTPVAVVFGFLVYYFTVGKLVLYFSEALAFFVRATFTVLFAIICYPIRICVVFLLKIAKKILGCINKTLAKRRILMYNKNRKKSVLKEADLGFFGNAKKQFGGSYDV